MSMLGTSNANVGTTSLNAIPSAILSLGISPCGAGGSLAEKR